MNQPIFLSIYIYINSVVLNFKDNFFTKEMQLRNAFDSYISVI